MGELPMIENPTNQKKVCHVTSAHPRYDVRIFHKECKSLANSGFDVTLLVNDNLPNEALDGVKIVSTKLKPSNRYERMVKSKKYLRIKMIEIDADIYHFHDPELLPEGNWMKSKGKKIIFDFHEDVAQQILFKTWIPRKIRKLISAIYKKYEKKLSQRFDGLVTVTPKFVERLKQINPNTVMITNYPILKTTSNYDRSKKKRAICFAGGITPQWNHENIIKAIEQIDDIEYILAGSGPQDYLERLKSLQGWNKVRYLGRIPHEKVNEIYEESILGVALLSNNTQVGDEGTLGNTKLFEFMESGLPMICSNNKIWKEIIDKYECGVVLNPNSTDEIRGVIESIIDNHDELCSMGMNGRNAVEKIFNWRVGPEVELLDLYKRL
jgi:glycosyltransferase involved in cell wall biosynthesis